jgi:type IV pilus assembly protein PilM
MGLFSKDTKGQSYLGVDIGGSSIKMVELTNNQGRAQLVTYGFLERSMKTNDQSLLESPQEMARAIKSVFEKAKVKTNTAITALPASSVFSTVINLPEINRKDLISPKKISEAVEKEAAKVLPLPIDEMVLDWKILGENSEDEKANLDGTIKNLQVLLTAAARSLIQKYIDIFKQANINLLSLETESFAIARALVGKDKSTVIVVDIGAANTDISIVDNSVPFIERTVNLGGFAITQLMAKSLGVSLDQAEQFKRDLVNYPASLPQGKLLPPVIEQAIRPIVNEVKYLIEFFNKQPGQESKRVQKIILSGGTAKLFNFPAYFTEIFNIRTFLGDPWARVIYPDNLKPVLDQVGTRLAVAIGLAMREIEK